MRTTATIFLGLLLLPAVSFADPAVTWEQIDDDEGVVVSSKEVPGSDLVAFRGETVMDAPLEKVLWVLMDNDHRLEWVDRLAKSEVLERVNDFEYILYQHFALPWFLSDRDYVYRGKGWRKADGTVYLDMSSEPHKDSPETVGVRADLRHSRYILTPEADGKKTRVVVEIHTDPKGAVPDWLVNIIQKSWPEKTLNGVRTQLAKKHVKEYPLPPIKGEKRIFVKGASKKASTAAAVKASNRKATKKKTRKKASKKARTKRHKETSRLDTRKPRLVG